MILLVDDDTILTETVSHILKYNKYDVTVMNSGNSAISWLSKNDPCDLIITDIHMKNGTGIDLVTWQKKHRSKIPVLIITGDHEIDLHETEQFCEIMHLPVVKKPFTTQKLLGVTKAYYKNSLSELA
jgi:two-component system response regulator RegX3